VFDGRVSGGAAAAAELGAEWPTPAAARDRADLVADAQSRGALAERRRLGRELHDSVSQELYGIVLAARSGLALLHRDPGLAAQALDSVVSLAEVALSEVRGLILDLRPDAVTASGLAAALSREAAAVSALHGIEVETALVEPAIPPDAREAVYWVAREALHNAVKHARPRRIRVRLESGPQACVLEVADDGTGFEVAWRGGGLGLCTMRERAAAVGAELEIASAAGAGTSVRLRLRS
jgi:signal transduction histidine kinase